MVQESNGEDLFSPTSRQPGEDFLIVGLGASAGGINALKQFFSEVRADSGIAYVVILHLSPDHESILAEVLQSNCSIPVVQVKERTLVEPDRVYVIPPNQSLTINDGHLVLSEVTRRAERRAPIDIFFRTLAESHHSRAACVILSGTGADGSMGMKRVKENGGVCIVQDTEEAEYADMPRNAIATGLVDYVLPVAEMASTITAYKNRRAPVNLTTDRGSKTEIDEKALRNIFTHLRVRTGHDFSSYKRATILRRIERRISVNNLPHIAAYSVFMREHPEEATKLLKDLLISVTNFFRDASSFETLQREIIPKLLQQKKSEDYVRVWIAGCATGEEAYSLAILFSEAIERLADPPKIQLFATDIDERAIQKAREGYYSLNDAADVSPERLRRFFNNEGDGYRVRRELRELVLFATHNLIKDPPFSQVQLVTCRNLLIYLNRNAQERIMQILHFALEPGGYLFLGTSESIEVARELFVSIDKKNPIYRSRPVETRLPLKFDKLTMPRAITLNQLIDRTVPGGVPERLSYFDLHHRLLEKYAPPSIVVNEEHKVLHLSESAGRYLRVGGGEPSYNLLKLVRQELRPELRTALYQAGKLRTDVVARDLKIRIDDAEVTLNLIIKPVLTDEAAQQGYTLVLFDETRGEQQSDATAKIVASGAPIARELEEQLARNKAQLRGTIEQHELQQEELNASNEELQAMNEELRSAAEELETSKEELQSVNEELTTVNQELNVKIEELSQANSDFQNLIDSTEIATVFLDRSMRVKLFTPRARDVFSLIPADTGRLLSDINSRLIYDRLLPDIEQVIDRLQTIQREVRTNDDKEYLMSIFPYRTADDRIDGAVLTFVDVTSGKRAEEARRITEEHLKLLLESIKDYAIFSMDEEGKIKSWGPGAQLTFGYAADEVIGQDAAIIFTAEDRAAGMPEQEMSTALRKGRAADERWHVRKDGSRFYASGVLAPLLSKNGGFVKIARDLTDEKLLAEELQQAHDELETRVARRTSELANANESLMLEVHERIRSEGLRVDLNRRLVRAQEDERQRIARDLHDQMGQQLTALRLKLETLKNNFTFENNAATQVEECQNIALQIEAEVDFLAWELRPAALDDLGLKETLAAYVTTWSDHYGIAAEFHSSLDHERLAPEVETNLYRIAQEALNNICKHAQATRVDVILERRDNEVVLIIEDDGVGFDGKLDPAARSGLGLVGMSERTLLMGGKLDIESVPNQGTTLFARVPISEANQS